MIALETRLDAELPGAVETLQRLRPLAADDAHRAHLDSLVAAVPSIQESLRALFAELNDELDPETRDLFERIVLAQPWATSFLAPAAQPAARPVAALVGPPLEGDAFLSGRRLPWVLLANALFRLGTALDVFCVFNTKLPKTCAAGEGASFVAALIFEVMTGDSGAITALKVGQTPLTATSKPSADPIPTKGITLKAWITVERRFTFATSSSALLEQLAERSKNSKRF